MRKVITGLAGTGSDNELEIVKESEKAYYLRFDGKQFWLPKAAFGDDGELTDWGYTLLEEKTNPTEEQRLAAREWYLKKHPELRRESASKHIMQSRMDSAIKRDET